MNVDISKIIRGAIRSEINKINTAFPARVVSVDGWDVDVQPLIAQREGLSYRVLPTIPSVPFLPPAVGKDRGIFFRPDVGDDVMIVCSQTSYDAWLISGDLSNEGISTKHSLSDAIAISGFQSIPNRNDYDPDRDGILITNKGSKISIKSNGEVVINDGEGHAISWESVNTSVKSIMLAIETLSVAVGIETPTMSDVDSGKINKVRL